MHTVIKYKYITDLSISELNSHIVIPCLNEEGYKTLLLRNAKQKRIQSVYQTKKLLIKRNSVLVLNGNEFFFHIVICKEQTEFMNRNFDIIYDYLFKKLESEIDEYELSELLFSIEDLFAKSSENIELLQIGTAGELLTLMLFIERGYLEILHVYHRNNFSKHDIEFSNKYKLEIKTTLNEKRIHRFSHTQLTSNDKKIHIASVVLSLVENGLSLYQLFLKIIEKIDDYEIAFSIKKLMNFVSIDSSNQGIVFDYKNSIDSIRIIDSNHVPKINCELPDGITNVHYDSDCSFSESTTLSKYLEIIKQITRI